MLKAIIEAIMILVMMLTGCTASGGEADNDVASTTYTQITQDNFPSLKPDN